MKTLLILLVVVLPILASIISYYVIVTSTRYLGWKQARANDKREALRRKAEEESPEAIWRGIKEKQRALRREEHADWDKRFEEALPEDERMAIEVQRKEERQKQIEVCEHTLQYRNMQGQTFCGFCGVEFAPRSSAIYRNWR